MNARTRGYGVIRDAIKAARIDADSYGVESYDGREFRAWDARPFSETLSDIRLFDAAFVRAYTGWLSRRLAKMTDDERQTVDRIAELNRTLRESKDPGLVREVRELRARVEQLEQA